MTDFQKQVVAGIPAEIPPMPAKDPRVVQAPARRMLLSDSEKVLAVKNALRYFPDSMHTALAPEFATELARHGRIYMHRFRPSYRMRAHPIDEYPARSRQAAAIMAMIQNNLDIDVAQHPYELITYGGNGTVFQNWAQYLLTMKYLSEMTDEQTLVLYSGHPLGLFPSSCEAPRVVLSNGMVIPNYSGEDDYDRMSSLGVTMYGQMTAGSFMYIGSQGIVHGTTITLLNAGRQYLGLGPGESLQGRVFVSSGLGGMSCAQAKAAVILGAVGVIAEINPQVVERRHEEDEWLDEYETDLDKLLVRIERARAEKEPVSLGYLGNVVDLWERLVDAGTAVDLGSDQTSLNIPFSGGYYPVGLTYEESQEMMEHDQAGFRERVRASLRRQVEAINTMVGRGMHFWDYGNGFLLQASQAGAEGLVRPDGTNVYPSYVQDIMGPLFFDYGFGPFRWVCMSQSPADLATTDEISTRVLEDLVGTTDPQIRQQMLDNIAWIREAGNNNLVRGSQARILYADRRGRIEIALAFNQAIAEGTVTGPVVIGRDHHDVSGTDSPYRETANIYDGSKYCADMAVQNVLGDAFRGATWVSLHNGGGVGWGEVINGGFGMVLDGSQEAARRARGMLSWDVSNGLARRAWAGNEGAVFAVKRTMERESEMAVTLPSVADEKLVAEAVSEAFAARGLRQQDR